MWKSDFIKTEMKPNKNLLQYLGKKKIGPSTAYSQKPQEFKSMNDLM